jgi:hypothetical protein
MRFVVPVPSVYARPNPKYFGRRGGATWLNMVNDQAAGLGGKVVAGTPRDSLYVLDVLYDRDGGRRPEMIVTDTASYLAVREAPRCDGQNGRARLRPPLAPTPTSRPPSSGCASAATKSAATTRPRPARRSRA